MAVPAPVFHRVRVPTRLLPLLLLSLWALAAPAGAVAPLRVLHPAQESGADVRSRYPLAVLHLALLRSGRPAAIGPAPLHASQERLLRLLEDGRHLDVMWTVTTAARERRLRPVRFPIDRGLIGWRVLLVRRDALPRFVPGADPKGALAALLGAQGHDWPDLAILRANGLRMASSPAYEGLFAMLARGHVDYVPRSVAEAADELAARPRSGLAIEPRLLLRYPSALYFFVNPDNEALAQALETGLERAQADGSLQRLFDRAHGPVLARLDLDRRVVVPLANPLQPPGLPLHRRELWYGVAR